MLHLEKKCDGDYCRLLEDISIIIEKTFIGELLRSFSYFLFSGQLRYNLLGQD